MKKRHQIVDRPSADLNLVPFWEQRFIVLAFPRQSGDAILHSNLSTLLPYDSPQFTPPPARKDLSGDLIRLLVIGVSNVIGI